MKTTRIEFASDDNQRIATVRRKDEYLLAELFSPEAPDGRKHWIGADDEDDIREFAQILLEKLGYHVVATRDGMETLSYYKKGMQKGTPYHAVIMDLTIRGGLGGVETIEKLLKIDPKAKAIVASGYANNPVMSNYTKYGFKAIIKKPYKAKELGDVLAKVLEKDE